ncbi:hypothetical protein BTO16_12215 [Polaribacter glomeratus]|uniref:Uncharacterized protein n=1 Tax=Polaribacter glomeratus TaxID=102 RepID=A0A2S7WGV4_9FLAO|nr:hypothetical protein BTO16_12215 [Polaribacter glomeratus]
MFFFLSCNSNFYGDKDVGGDFYYMVEPAFNSIYIAKIKDSPYQYLGPYVIENIESLGFNDRFILISNKKNDSLKYFLIDKEKELNRNYEDRLQKTYSLELDSLKFEKLIVIHKIKIKTNEEYRKENGWE